MQRLFGLAGQIAIHGDQVAGPRSLARNNDLIVAQSGFEREFGGLHGRKHHALIDDLFGFQAEIFVGVFLHFGHDQLLIQGAAIDADADGFAVVASDLADGGELFVAALAGADITGIDSVFVERLGAFRIFREQHVAVVVEVADDRNVAACREQTLLDFGNRRQRLPER